MVKQYFQFEMDKTKLKQEIIAGMLMISPIKNLNFNEFFKHGIGLTAGFVTNSITK